MSIHLKRISYTTTIDALICIAARYSATADGARQQALDDIAASLNNVAALIARHRLADMLNQPVPPVPSRQVDDGELDPDELAEDAPAEELTAEPKLHPRQAQIYRYIKNNPGCTGQMLADHCGITLSNLSAQLSYMRNADIKIISTDTRPTRYRIG